MNGIGIWYRVEDDELPNLDIHINIWNLRNNLRGELPFIDVGVVVPEFRKVDGLDILFPFSFNMDSVFDLYDYLKNPDIARLVFNETGCEVSSKDRYSVIKTDQINSPKLLIFLDFDGNNSTVSLRCDNDNTTMHFCFKDIGEDDRFSEYKDLYFRFRIKDSNIKKALFCPLQKKNWFLESGFISTQIVDLKINQERNLPINTCREYRIKKYRFAKIRKLHFFIMNDSRDEITCFGNESGKCRMLEDKAWDSYLENQGVSNILAYHWSKGSEEDCSFANFSMLVKISSSTTNYRVIIIYMVVVSFLGMVGSALFEILKDLICI